MSANILEKIPTIRFIKVKKEFHETGFNSCQKFLALKFLPSFKPHLLNQFVVDTKYSKINSRNLWVGVVKGW